MKKNIKGFSLIEMLIVVGIFSFLAIIVTQSLSASLRNSRKSENLGKVRENLEYTMNYIERTLRTAKSLSPLCSGDTNDLTFITQTGATQRFRYISATRTINYDAIGTGNGTPITNSQIRIENDSLSPFTCVPGTGGRPDSVTIRLTARDATTNASAESSRYTATTTISLRNYSRN